MSCFITIVIAVIFGLMTLSSEEYYWTHEYLLYAKMKQKELDNSSNKEVTNVTKNDSNQKNSKLAG